MKTTVKTSTGESVTVQPLPQAHAVMLTVFNRNTGHIDPIAHTAYMTVDEVGALIFGMESALELLDVQRANYGVQA
jgi:hypothetical protein